jgi:hypothetical protein
MTTHSNVFIGASIMPNRAYTDQYKIPSRLCDNFTFVLESLYQRESAIKNPYSAMFIRPFGKRKGHYPKSTHL